MLKFKLGCYIRYLRLVDVGSVVGVGSQSRRINSFVKIGFPCNELLINEINFPKLCMSDICFPKSRWQRIRLP